MIADQYRVGSGTGELWTTGFPQQLVIRKASDSIGKGTVYRPVIQPRVWNDAGRQGGRYTPLAPAVVDTGMPKFC
jgi:hypothetical protein